MAQFDFDPSTVETREGFDGELLPAGNYLSVITASAVKDTKDKTGKYIEIEETIQQEGYRGRKVWTNLNVRNKSEKAEKIGQEQLKELLIALGRADRKMTDTGQLHGIPHVIKVFVEKDESGRYSDKNGIKGFLPASKGAGSPAQPRPTPAASGPAPAPWMNKPTTGQAPEQTNAQATSQAPAQAPAEQPVQPPAQPAANVPPWMKRA